MQFRCRLASSTGEVIEGTYVADSEARLRHDLEARGLHVLSLRPKGIAGLAVQLPQRAAIPEREFLVFNQQLATLLKAGMPLVQSLDLLKRQVEVPALRSLLDDVHERVRAGASLSDAFGEHGAAVPSVYTASLLAGERSGNLDGVLRRYVEYSKTIAAVKRKTVSALVYPAILTVLSLGVVAIIVLKVVPEFSDFYASFGTGKEQQLPFFTGIIVGVSDFIRARFLWIALAIVAGIAALIAWVRQPGQKARFDHALLGIPMLGDVARKFSTSQMARTLATLLGGGLPLVNALDIAAKSVGNRYIAKQLGEVSAHVREGQSFAAALEARGVFPDVAVRMAEVGESTGALQDMLNTVADFYDEEVATRMERFVAVIEPALLVVMGIVIASLLIALYMPLLQVSSVVNNG